MDSRFHDCVAGWSTSKTRTPADGIGIAQAESVQAGPKDNNLAYASRDGIGDRILCKSAACCNKEPLRTACWVTRRTIRHKARVFTKNGSCKRIEKNVPVFGFLVGRPVRGSANGCHAWLLPFHDL